MTIAKTIYTCGDIGSVRSIIGLMKAGKCPGLYFVYKTKNPRFLYQIGTFSMLMLEKDSPVILGIASSKHASQKIVCHIISNMPEDK